MLGSLRRHRRRGRRPLTGWTLADPIIAAGIGLFIVPRTWILLKQAIHILMEGTPTESTSRCWSAGCWPFPA